MIPVIGKRRPGAFNDIIGMNGAVLALGCWCNGMLALRRSSGLNKAGVDFVYHFDLSFRLPLQSRYQYHLTTSVITSNKWFNLILADAPGGADAREPSPQRRR